MRTQREKGKDADRAKRRRREKPPATGNQRLAAQSRKILGKHYASKYRTR